MSNNQKRTMSFLYGLFWSSSDCFILSIKRKLNNIINIPNLPFQNLAKIFRLCTKGDSSKDETFSNILFPFLRYSDMFYSHTMLLWLFHLFHNTFILFSIDSLLFFEVLISTLTRGSITVCLDYLVVFGKGALST